MEYNDSCLNALHRAELEILDEIDRFCRKHGIAYSLYAGSLLGAVRHQDFIPWDDDLDVCMLRGEYERFLELWPQEPHDGFILQRKETDENFSHSFVKVRKDHTAFVQLEHEPQKGYHTGIFVDVFPLDRMPQGKLRVRVYRWRYMLYHLFTREFLPEAASPAVRRASEWILRLTRHSLRMKAREKLLAKLTKFNGDERLGLVGTETMQSLRCVFPPDMMDSFVFLPFGERTYMCTSQWDAHLKAKYGDYMKLPPEEERVWKHNPLLVDFEHNYGEL